MKLQRRPILIRTFFALVMCTVATWAAAEAPATPPAQEKMTPIDARRAVPEMTPGTNIGNTLENTAQWETGWGNPPITKEYIHSLARLGFKSVRLPVAWDTYADNGTITATQFNRVAEVVDWITAEGMYCVVNIHWDGGWIDSDWKERFPDTYHTFSPAAEKKFRSYWTQIATFFKGKNQKLIFEAFNEESTFSNVGSEEQAYATLTRVNQIFVDTVRQTGGNNTNRLLIIPGWTTDISKTCQPQYRLPKDTVAGKLFVSVHYYTPWQFVGLSEDANWGKMIPTWGSDADVKQLNDLFDQLNDWCTRNNTPAYIGEFSMCSKKDVTSRQKWLTSVGVAAVKRKMVPVLWDTGGGVTRREPHTVSPDVVELLKAIQRAAGASPSVAK